MYSRYSEVLGREHQAELLQQAAHIRLLSTRERQQEHRLPLYCRWAYSIGHSRHMGGRLERVGTCPVSSTPPHVLP